MDFIQEIGNTPLPQIFIIGGFFFLVLSVANKLGTKIDINPKRQGQAVIIGIILVLAGLFMYFQPKPDKHNTEINEGQCIIRIYSVPNNETLHIKSTDCKIHISKGNITPDNEEQEKEDTRFHVRVNDIEIPPVSNISTFKDEHGAMHLEQFFKLHEIKPGLKYQITVAHSIQKCMLLIAEPFSL